MGKLPTLSKNYEFQRVYNKGRYAASKSLVIYVLSNRKNAIRFGITTSKKVGNSIVRHRFARLVRESYRLHENIFNSGLDIVVIARNSAAGVNYAEIESALLHLGKLHGIIRVFFNYD